MDNADIAEVVELTNNKQLSMLLNLIPAKELAVFYEVHSAEMVLLTAEDIERNDAIKEVLRLLSN